MTICPMKFMLAELDEVPEGHDHLLGKQIAADPASDISLACASQWFNNCLSLHKTCRSLFSAEKPLPILY